MYSKIIYIYIYIYTHTHNAGDPGLNSGVGKIPWGSDRLPTPAFVGFPQGSAGNYPPSMQETWV